MSKPTQKSREKKNKLAKVRKQARKNRLVTTGWPISDIPVSPALMNLITATRI